MKKKILPPAYFMSAILLIAIVHFTIPVLKIINFPWNLTGILLLILGGILNLIADKSFKNFNTTVKPFEYSSKLIQDGIFKLTRNPMYLGMCFILLGESILLGSILPF
jgi:protein-S-isoprenylcysteine O-methyltransferase Ste14